MYLKRKHKIAIASIIVIILLVSTSIFAYYEYFREEKKTESKVQEFQLDDRISPLTNQALFVEILRIRHRGILDTLMKRGLGWKDKPSFYYVIDAVGQEYSSAEVQGGVASGGSSENLFNTWDTILRENKVVFDVAEEQATAEITIKVVERTTSGIIFKKNQDTEKLTMQLTYDFRTGRWSGDDYFMDDDGYGHYLGDTFEIWFNIYQSDLDWDHIPYWVEVNLLHTDPRVDDTYSDPDSDGIPTYWEWRWGYDPFVWDDHENLDPDVDGIENIEEYKMSKYFSDPYQPDIYIETDGMVKGWLLDPPHVFHKEAQEALIERFSEHGINVYIDDGWPDGPINGGGEMLPHDYEKISQDSGMMLQYYLHHFSDDRKGIFRYVLFAHQAGFNHPSKGNRYDTIAVGTNLKTEFKVKFAFTPRTQILMEAAYTMHELGHSLGIEPWTHEGCDNFSYVGSRQQRESYDEIWGNYYSVMNYYHITDKTLIDYSDGSHGYNDFDDWSHLYLPTFEVEARVVEGIGFELPLEDQLNGEVLEHDLIGWEYNENLSKEFNQKSMVKWADTIWFVYEKNDNATQPSNRTIRVYAFPNVYPVDSDWTLSYEGVLDKNGNIQVYSQQSEVQRLLDMI